MTIVLAIDAATKVGFALGEAGKAPRSWSQRLKDGDDDPERAFKKLGITLRDLFMVEKPDLVIVEAPIQMGAMIEADSAAPRGFKFKSNPETIYLLTGLVAGVFTICGPYGIRCRKANVQAVRKHVVGKARPADPKKAVLERCWQIAYLPRDCRDDNRADAIALHIWASDHLCKPATRELHLMQEQA
ncbi:MAG: hypothetical protein KGZ68_01000 [Dechloromonas sp.]|nr:hypothetical protein [Dechloromonas sp.]